MSKKKNNSGKYASKRHRKKSRSSLITLLFVVVALLAIGIALMLYFGTREDRTETPDTQTTQETETISETTGQLQTVPVKENSINLGYGIYVTDIASYTGMYMEDGSDEILSNILMLVVQNNGAQDIQYAEITMEVGDQQASFSMTTLPVGESMVLLEKNRMSWDASVDYTAILPKVENIAYFQEPMSIQEDKLKIQIVDGAINVTNISGEDIAGNIVVYYKNAAEDIYYGGITYRVTLDGGLKADEIRQVMTNHASDTGSKIMFVTISQ